MNKEYQDTTIFIGLDVHANSWSAFLLSDHLVLKQLTFPPSPERLASYLKRSYPRAKYKCAYEAGYQGFWICDHLQGLGVETIVVHPADIPMTDKERRFKDDQRDSRKIAMALRSGQLEGIYVPSPEQIRDRNLVRQRYKIHSDVQRIQNRIRSHLSFTGPLLSKDEIGQYWSNRMIKALRQKAEQDSDIALELLLDSLNHNRQMDLAALRQVRKMSRSEGYKENVRLLCSIPGVGVLTAMVFLTEIGDVSRFAWDQLHAYCGLIPGSHSSGDREIKSRMTKRGNKYIKTALILSSWVAVRYDPELTQAYEQLCRRMKGQQAIIRIAKKLANRMRSVLLNRTEFVKK